MTRPDPSPPPARLAADLRRAAVFLTRLPLRPPPGDAGSLAGALCLAPLIGLAVGAAGAAVFALALVLGLPPLAGGALAIAATVWITGGLHEDGLADVADGFGGGFDRARKLAIMRDHQIGTYGVIALGLSLLLRAAALADLAGPAAAAAGLVAAHALGRAVMPALMLLLRPARADGLGAGAGRLRGRDAATALGLGAVVALAALGWGGIAALAAALAAAAVVAWLAARQIGGYTGDVLGAGEQAAETAVLLTAAAWLTA